MKYFLILFTILILNACSITVKEAPFKHIDLSVTSSVEFDTNVGEKVEGNVTCKRILGIFTTYSEPVDIMGGDYPSYGILNKCFAKATYLASSSVDADILLNPQYIYEEDSGLFTLTYKVKVMGYAGYFTPKGVSLNFKSTKSNSSTYLKLSKPTSVPESNTKKNTKSMSGIKTNVIKK